jgi:murein DD-endopeptidase MepM/ murein hydrolase activator NlpD
VRSIRAFRAALLTLILSLVWPALSEGAPQRKSSAKSRKASPATVVRSSGTKAVPVRKVSRKRRAAGTVRNQAASRAAAVLEVYGPFLPPSEPFDHPRAPCEPEDLVLEAFVHDDAEEDAREAEEAALLESRAASLFGVAKRIGSFLRPKSASARVSPEDVDLTELLSARLRIPVEGVDADRLRDSFLDRRGRYRKHLAIDIGAPRGTPVIATADGEVVKLQRERRGGITIYQKDPTGKYLFFYCHLSRYARGLAVGQRVAAGEVIGYVGSTGRVIGGPHLHFSITRVPEDDDIREGLAVNPYLLFLAGVP